MNAKEMIDAMSSNGTGTAREGDAVRNIGTQSFFRGITVKGTEARFQKSERGRFGLV